MISRSMRHIPAVLFVLLFAGCALHPTFPPGEACVARGFTVTDGFSGARRGSCTVLSANHVRLEILPEDETYINNSPWYAFRITPTAADTAKVTLQYQGGTHRYWPKTSLDGLTWIRLADGDLTTGDDGARAEFMIPLSAEPVYVSAQELVTVQNYDAWNGKMAAAAGLRLNELGKSLLGQPIFALDNSAESDDVLLLIGRQHPPEVSGAFAFFAFTETLFGESDLARRFRERFRVIAIPLMNPDGVEAGNWRHNLGHVDINRDWGPFTQPETRMVGELLDELDAGGSTLRMFVDFHSTNENVFYTQQEPTNPTDFARTWLDNAALRIDGYAFRNGEAPAQNPAVAKNYVYTRYGIPAVTYEVGEETDRGATQAAARVFAEELMRLMLEQEY